MKSYHISVTERNPKKIKISEHGIEQVEFTEIMDKFNLVSNVLDSETETLDLKIGNDIEITIFKTNKEKE